MSLTGGHAPLIALVEATASEIAALPALAGVEWLSCHPKGPGLYDFRRGDEHLFQLDFADALCPLADLIAIVAKSGNPVLSALETFWVEKLPAKRLAFKHVADFGPAAMAGVAVSILSEALTVQRRLCGQFALDLAVYREEFDRLEHNFAALEAYVAAVDINTPQEIFTYPAGADSIDLTRADGRTGAVTVGGTLKQLLPVNSIGVAGIAMSLSAIPPHGSPPLHAVLRAVETDGVFGRWVIDPAERTVGWISLVLDRAIDDMALSLILEISWPAGCSGWRVDLGPPHPNPAVCAQADGEPPQSAPIAMRIVGSVPGATPTAATDAILPTGARAPLTALVPKSAYASVSAVGDDPEDTALVLYDPQAEFIQVHPNGPGKITIAKMTVTAPAAAWRVTARTHLANEVANPTDFSLLVLKEGEALPDMAPLSKERRAQAGFSGWQTIDPMQHGALSVLLFGAGRARLDVYLLTRQKGTHEYAWARFSDLQLHLGPPSPALGRMEPTQRRRSTEQPKARPSKSELSKNHASRHGRNTRRSPR